MFSTSLRCLITKVYINLMAISRKPKPSTAKDSSVDIQALIERGGKIAGEEGKEPGDQKKLVPVMLRLPPAMLKKVDAAVEARDVPTARTTWIMEAITEKLKREVS